MKALYKVACTALALILLCTPVLAVTAEQIQPVMPVIDVYVHQNEHDLSTLTAADITAALDGAPLQVEGFEESDQGIYYVFMLDISTSMPQKHLRAVCDVIAELHAGLRPRDQLALITFGEKVDMLLQGGENADTVRAALDSVQANANATCFFEAMTHLAATASTKQDMRRVAVMVSDGVNFSDSGMTQDQVETALRESGVAVYALDVDINPAGTQQLDNFTTLTGGRRAAFTPDSAGQALDEMLFSADRVWHLRLRADNNIADGETHRLQVQFGDLSTLETDIRPTLWQIDAVPPQLLTTHTDTDAHTIQLQFSEAMANADTAACYILRSPAGDLHTPDRVEVQDTTATLHCAALTDEPGWTLAIEGLTDASMEKNTLAATTLAITRTPSAEPQAPAGPTGAELEQQQAVTGLVTAAIAVAALLVLGGIVAAALVLRRRRAAARSAASGKTASNTTRARAVTFVFEEDGKK